MNATTNRVILVTGASSGLGWATAAYLAERGHRVYGTSRRPETAPAAAWPMLALDVCSDASAQRCVAEIKAREGRIDALVNNAGHAFIGAIEETEMDDAYAQLETNFFGALRMMRAVLPQMREQAFGRIVNVSSLAGAVPFPFLGVYGASKHALEAVSESLEYELAGTGIRVTIMEPDGMRTSIGFRQPRQDHAALGAKRQSLLRRLEHNTREGGIEPQVFAREVAHAIESDTPALRIVIGDMAGEMIEARRSLPEARFRAIVAERVELAAGTAAGR